MKVPFPTILCLPLRSAYPTLTPSAPWKTIDKSVNSGRPLLSVLSQHDTLHCGKRCFPLSTLCFTAALHSGAHQGKQHLTAVPELKPNVAVNDCYGDMAHWNNTENQSDATWAKSTTSFLSRQNHPGWENVKLLTMWCSERNLASVIHFCADQKMLLCVKCMFVGVLQQKKSL